MSSKPVIKPLLLCQSCAVPLDNATQQPSCSEKAESPPLHFACGHAVCGVCQRRTPHLARQCLLCDDPIRSSAVSRTRTQGPSAKGRSGGGDGGAAPPSFTSDHDDDFVIGELDDDDDQDDHDDEGRQPLYAKDGASRPPPVEGELPPPYHDFDDRTPHDDEKAPFTTVEETSRVYQGDDEKGGREQCSLHYIKPDDTLSGLALAYRVDGATLARMNKLPTSTLTTTPSLLHTLPFIILPPSVTRSSSTEPVHPPEVERRRLVLRRFQVHTRCADWAVASAYCSQVFDARDKEADFVRENRRQRGESIDDVVPRQGGELEEAIEAWKRDEAWEKSAKGKGSALGSKLKSTGLVESQVKGWSRK